MPWIVHPRPLNRFPHTVRITLTLRIAFQNVIAHTVDAAARKTLKIVIADIQLSFVAVETGPGVDAAVAGAAECRLNAVVVGLAEDLLRRCQSLALLWEGQIWRSTRVRDRLSRLWGRDASQQEKG